jgi:hypothetical protein
VQRGEIVLCDLGAKHDTAHLPLRDVDVSRADHDHRGPVGVADNRWGF